MAVVYGQADSVKEIAERLIPSINRDLSTIKILYLFRDKPFKVSGTIVPGVVRKVPDYIEHVCDYKFAIIIGLPTWNDYNENQRLASIDHLISMIHTQENENTGDITFKIVKPPVQEFPEVVARNGLWNDTIVDMANVIK